MKFNYFFITISILFLFYLSSCTTRKTTYIHKNAGHDSVEFYTHKAPEYKLKPKDVIDITIISTNEKINSQFGITKQSLNIERTTGYQVNDTGYIQVPILGMFNVSGKTMKAVRELVQERTNEFVIDAISYVTLESFEIIFIGETMSGILKIPDDHIDILKAFAMKGVKSGDLSKVMIMRKTETGSEIFKVDLTDRNLLESEKFYLYPEDRVLIRELPLNNLKKNYQENMFFLTSITSIVSMYLFVMQLLK